MSSSRGRGLGGDKAELCELRKLAVLSLTTTGPRALRHLPKTGTRATLLRHPSRARGHFSLGSCSPSFCLELAEPISAQVGVSLSQVVCVLCNELFSFLRTEGFPRESLARVAVR